MKKKSEYPDKIRVRASIDKNDLFKWIDSEPFVQDFFTHSEWVRSEDGHYNRVLSFPYDAQDLGYKIGDLIIDTYDFDWTVNGKYGYDQHCGIRLVSDDCDKFVVEFEPFVCDEVSAWGMPDTLFTKEKLYSKKTGITYELIES